MKYLLSNEIQFFKILKSNTESGNFQGGTINLNNRKKIFLRTGLLVRAEVENFPCASIIFLR